MLLRKAIGSNAPKTYSDDVFLTNVRTGTGGTTTVTGGPDMSTKGGLCITKSRSAATGWRFVDTTRGATLSLDSSSTAAAVTESTGLTAFTSSGATFGADTDYNNSGATYVDYFLRKASKFFDVITYTGDGAASRTLGHALGISPGFIIIKRTDTTSNWAVAARKGNNTSGFNAYTWNELQLNTTSANIGGDVTGFADSANFKVGTNLFSGDTNVSSATYVAYLFAHDPDTTNGIIQAGSFTTDGSGNATVTLGWEPQWLLVKRTDAASAWNLVDSMRVWTAGSGYSYLMPNISNAEASTASTGLQPTATGFIGNSGTFGASATYIYLAIRRPNKPPTSGTQVFKSIARAGTSAAATISGSGFVPDMLIAQKRDSGAQSAITLDRLRGADLSLYTSMTNTENNDSYYGSRVFTMDGIQISSGTGSPAGSAELNSSAYNYINHFFKRAPGFMSVLCSTGTGSNKTEAHDLGVAPELWLWKGRSGATTWVWGSSLLANTQKIVMPSPNGVVTDTTAWNSAYPTSSVISLGTLADVNTNAATYVGYLWATLPGVSKVFSYTGNGSSQTINCGFAAGARFIMILRTTASTAQDIFVWDTVRGIVASNDPHLSLNTTAAEVTTDDSIDPDNSGFIVNENTATHINVNGAVYIGLAIA